ncbi:MAG: preprotein translocase subunit SecG [Anaerolineales bacterium]|nr:preprotein translocase subunit SecG [Anaerolineales bacterium]
MVFEEALQVIQIIISVGLIALIILQAGGAGLGNLFGGTSGGAIQKTRRGLEKTLFQMTIGFAVAFVLNAILQLLIG